MLVPSSMRTDTLSSHFQIWTSPSPLSYYNGSQRTQNKQAAAAGTKRHITLTIPKTLEKLGSLEVLHARVSLWQLTTMDY